jgi:hypothetical protein
VLSSFESKCLIQTSWNNQLAFVFYYFLHKIASFLWCWTKSSIFGSIFLGRSQKRLRVLFPRPQHSDTRYLPTIPRFETTQIISHIATCCQKNKWIVSVFIVVFLHGSVELPNFFKKLNNKETSFTQQQHSVKLAIDLQPLLQVNLSSLVVDTIQKDQVIEWIFTMWQVEVGGQPVSLFLVLDLQPLPHKILSSLVEVGMEQQFLIEWICLLSKRSYTWMGRFLYQTGHTLPLMGI